MTPEETEEMALPATMYETGPDEAFLVGTEAEIRNLARMLIAHLEEPHPKIEYRGVECFSSNRRLTDKSGDVCIGGMLLAESKEDARRLVEVIRRANGL